MQVQSKQTIYKTSVQYNRTYDIHEVAGRVYAFSDDELIDFCDANNWGGVVLMRSEYYAKVKVYTD